MRDDKIQREIEFARISLDNMDRFSETFELCFGQRVGARYFDWKYRQNPLGPIIGFEAIHKGTLIASYGVIPESYEIDGERTIIYQSMDTMTHPSYQRRELFQKIAKLTDAYLREKDHRLDLLGLPGVSSYHGYVDRLGWKKIHDFTTIFLPHALFGAVKRLYRGPKLTFKTVRELTPELFAFLEKRPRSTRPMRNALTPAFFDWRVFNNPFKRFNVVQIHDGADLVGVVVSTTNAERRTNIHFFDLASKELFASHTPPVIEHLFAENRAIVVATWKPMNQQLAAGYQRCGFVHNPLLRGPMAYRQPMIVRSDTGRIRGVDVYDGRNYDLQPIMQN